MIKWVAVAGLVWTLAFGFAMDRSLAREMMEKSEEISRPVGATVKNMKGEDLGIITDVVTGPGGRMAFAILTFWISDDTQRRIAVPIRALSCQEHKCVLNASKERLAHEPPYGPEDELKDSEVAENIYRYFGMQPYWTGEERVK